MSDEKINIRKKALRKKVAKRREAITKDMLTVEEVAELLHVGIRTIWRYDELEKIPAPYRFGRLKRWKLADIELWWELDCPTREKFERQKQKG